MKTKKFQLKNGLTVIFNESHKSPVVSIQAWVRTGSADEGKTERGLSHFIEHLLFKGTDKYAPGEVAKVIEGSGGEFNAYTSFDQTVFYVTISSEFSDIGLDVISQMVGHPIFDQTEVDNEREVVVEEIKRGMDNPGRRLSRRLFSTIYKKHNYRQPVIGFEEIVRKSSVKKIKNFYRDRYTPKNMFLVVSGDFKSADMKKKVGEYFEPIESTKLRGVKREKEPAQKRTRISVEQSEFRETQGYIGWTIPGAKSKDIPALDVLALILGQGESSRLVKRLRLDQSLVNSIGSMAYTPKDHGVFAISYSLKEENYTAALEAILDEVMQVIQFPPSYEELQKSIINLQAEDFFSMETVDGTARKVGMFEFLFKDPEFFKQYNKLIQKLTPQDIQKVAKKYLKVETMNLIAMCNGSADNVEKRLKTFAKSFKERLKEKVKVPRQSAKKLKPLKFKSTRSGQKGPIGLELEKVDDRLRLIFAENVESHVVSMKLATPGGLICESAQKAGMSELLGRIWTAGSSVSDEHEINQRAEDLASSFFGFSGRNSMGMSFESLSCFEKQGTDLIFEVLSGARLPEEAIERETQIMLEQIKNRDDSPAQRCVLQFQKSLFGDHPYSRDSLGSESTLAGLDRGAIGTFLNDQLTPEKMVMVVAGRMDKDHWAQAAQDWCSRQQTDSSTPWSSGGYTPPRENLVEFIELKKEQSHLIVGYPGLNLSSPKRFDLSVLLAVLAGQGGRLFIELRDKESLAYTVSPLRFEGIDCGYVGAYIGCSPDKVEKSYELIKREFNKIATEAVSEDELERAKSYLIGKHDISLQRSSAVAYSVLFDELYGNPIDGIYQYVEQIRNVNSEDVRQMASQLFSGPEVCSLVGVNNPF